MKPQSIERQRAQLPTTEAREINLKPIRLTFRTRVIMWFMRWFLRPWLGRMVMGRVDKIAAMQLWLASRECKNTKGLPLDYVVIGRAPGHFLGKLTDKHKRCILYIHGGAFIMPAVPETHVGMVARICHDLDAVAFVVDYRLAPGAKFPAALDDCERAWRALLDLGFDPGQMIIAGESAGGNLTLGVLQRIRKAGLPMPCGAVPISPATEMGRIHSPPSRALKRKSDPILPMAALARVDEMYAGEWDASDPELSPVYADCRGFPPMYFLAAEGEVLLDDTVLMVRRAREAGVDVKFDVWPHLPHAFPLFERFMPECKQARLDITAFMKECFERAGVARQDRPARSAG